MPLKLLAIPDKFKGTLTATAVAVAIARGWRRARPEDTLELLPMSDGGDGFGEALSSLLGAKPQSVRTVDAAHRPCTAAWWWEARTRTAVIESARVIGLAQLPPGMFHPFELDTFGLGAVVHAALAEGARRLMIGVGGSATNDGGFGLARSLGWEFFDHSGKSIERWIELQGLEQIRPPKRHGRGQVIVAVDVQNQLLGARGATRIYGPQKGLRPRDFAVAEGCLRRLASVVRERSGRDMARLPGAGAAGGRGFGLMAFLRARAESGFDLFARHAQLLRRLRKADLVVTGEGALDRSTLMGKGVGQVGRACRRLGIPCIGLAGSVVRSAEAKRLFAQLHALIDLTTEADAKARPVFWLERLAERVARGWNRCGKPGNRA